MRKFKLKKDLPGWPRGTILKLDDDMFLTESGEETGIYSRAGNTEVALSKWATPIQDAPFSEWLEEIEPEPEYKRWRAENGGEYYCVEIYGVVNPKYEDGRSIDDGRYNIGNYFQTEEEAQALADYLKALAIVRDDAKGFVPDWLDGGQAKVYIGYSHYQGGLSIGEAWYDEDTGVFGLPYFATKEDAEASIDKHEKEWKITFDIKNEEGE